MIGIETMQDRMDKAEFHILLRRCSICKNKILLDYDPKHPDKKLFKCKVLGEVPEEIWEIETQDCKEFVLNEQSKSIELYQKTMGKIER